jgi:hypothetical protein
MERFLAKNAKEHFGLSRFQSLSPDRLQAMANKFFQYGPVAFDVLNAALTADPGSDLATQYSLRDMELTSLHLCAERLLVLMGNNSVEPILDRCHHRAVPLPDYEANPVAQVLARIGKVCISEIANFLKSKEYQLEKHFLVGERDITQELLDTTRHALTVMGSGAFGLFIEDCTKPKDDQDQRSQWLTFCSHILQAWALRDSVNIENALVERVVFLNSEFGLKRTVEFFTPIGTAAIKPLIHAFYDNKIGGLLPVSDYLRKLIVDALAGLRASGPAVGLVYLEADAEWHFKDLPLDDRLKAQSLYEQRHRIISERLRRWANN